MDIEFDLIEFNDLTNESDEFLHKCNRITQAVSADALSTVQLVEKLGPLLVDTSPKNRATGTAILSQVLSELPRNVLDHKQLGFICDFYADRLKDNHQVIPAVLRGILAIATFDQLPDGVATSLLTALFRNVACQQQTKLDRETIYNVIQLLQKRKTTEILSMGFDYVYGVISAVDGERDPKNLRFLFNWFPDFFKLVELGHLTEEAFDVLSCYFPVDFKAPQEDPNAITREILSDALSPCLCAVPQFAEYCFPLIMEKLDSSLDIAKLDSLKLLRDGCVTFDVSYYVQYSSNILSHIQRELFTGSDGKLKNICLLTLTTVIGKLSQSDEATFKRILKDTSDTIKGNLLPDSKLFEPSAQILIYIAAASKSSSHFMANEISPLLTNTFNITISPQQRATVLRNLIPFFGAFLKHHESLNGSDDLKHIPFLCLKASLTDSSDLSSTGFDTLKQIAQYLPQEVKNALYENLKDMLIVPHETQMRHSIMNCLEALSIHFPDEVSENLLKLIVVKDSTSLNLYLDTLCTLAIRRQFVNDVLNVFMTYLCRDLESATIAIKHFRRLLIIEEENATIQRWLLQNQTIDKLIMFITSQRQHLTIENNADYLVNLSQILKSIIGFHDNKTQSLLLEKHLPAVGSDFIRIFLLDGLLIRIHRDVLINYDILDDLTLLSLNKENRLIRNIAQQLLANLLNKCLNDNILNNYLAKISNGANEENCNFNYICTISWITKALFMRNHKKAIDWLERLFSLLDRNEETAKGFRILMDDNFDSLSFKSHCIKTTLYRQKLLVIVSNKLLENQTAQSTVHLMAFGYLLEFAPTQAVILQFEKIYKLIVLCLHQCNNEPEVVCVLLEILKLLISKKEIFFEDHSNEFLDAFVKLSIECKSLKVRILALQCIEFYASSGYQTYKLLPHKHMIISALRRSVDDPKRLVRKQAVDSRCAWFLLDAVI